MFNWLIVLFMSCLPVHTKVLNVDQVTNLLDISAVIRVKAAFSQDDGTSKLHMMGCSGTFIGPNTILTAGHCFERPFIGLWVKGHDGDSHKAHLLKVDLQKDLALLHVDGPKHMSSQLSKTVSVGNHVTNVGSPYFFTFLISEGTIAARNMVIKDFTAHYLVTTAMINPGSSGGGAFNDKGELVGVNTMTVGGPFGWAGITMAVDVPTIKEFLYAI